MAVNRRTIVLLLALAATIVVGGIVWTMSGGSAVPGTQARTPARTQPNEQGTTDEPPPHVKLDALAGQRAGPADADRNPFRFEERAPALPPGGLAQRPVNQSPTVPALPPTPTGPPPPPPIPLKFIGTVEQAGKRVAVLSDGRSSPQYGIEGTIILGQYRILKIGTETIEMSYVDGRGRQTIRLTGQ